MTYRIAVLPGDGTGPEVVAEGLKVLKAVAGPANLKFDFVPYDLGGERYLKTGEILPAVGVERTPPIQGHLPGRHRPPGCQARHPGEGDPAENPLRAGPVHQPPARESLPRVETPLKDKGPEDIDFVVVRENTEGLYVGAGGILK